jgi:hypothetical protein
LARGCLGPQEKKFFASFFQKRSACFLALLFVIDRGAVCKSWMPAFAGMTLGGSVGHSWVADGARLRRGYPPYLGGVALDGMVAV